MGPLTCALVAAHEAPDGSPAVVAHPFQLTYTLLLRLQMQRPAPVGIAVPDSGRSPSHGPASTQDGSTGSAGGVQSLVLVGSRAGGGVLIAFYVCFPHRLPAPLVEAVRDSCQRLLHRVLIRPLVPKLASSGDLAAELAALRRGTPGAFAVVRVGTSTSSLIDEDLPRVSSNANALASASTAHGSNTVPQSPGLDPEAADLADLRLTGRIGQGGGGAVYLGRMGGGLEVAVKLLEMPESINVGEMVDEAADEPGWGLRVLTRGSTDGSAASDGGLGAMLAAEVARQHLRARRSLLASATELAMLTSVSHPHILQVYGIYTNILLEPEPPSTCGGARSLRLRQRTQRAVEEDDDACLRDFGGYDTVYTAVCMTLCKLGSLASALASGDFPYRAPQAARMPSAANATPNSVYLTLLEVALALRYLHGRHIVHRDLKPGNVLLKGRSATSSDPRGFTAKLADFGCALVMDAPGTAAAAGHEGASGPGTPAPAGSGRYAVQDSVCGTLDHMAPEVVRGRGARITAAVDVYAFGVLMLEAITGGRRPFGSVPPERIGRLVAAGARPLFPTWAPEPYRALAEACWAHDPSQRPSAAQLVVAIRLQLQQQEMPTGSGAVLLGSPSKVVRVAGGP
ncbi:hypothetical protein GPECTOR_20g404 [Gonium pectorale]|uniref:Protein kinase domain-containing protein n=1 Tax=Gonium pectorale TaxID=33097 RepID=A0A150GJB3_GONPE|nr:hypothetical protein GPECTOR_20g404 [Gonium pectorale]|eukprot:KXZ49550.1 hypothetical protein GPECTOR_20g404 [Gonium pectorale]